VAILLWLALRLDWRRVFSNAPPCTVSLRLEPNDSATLVTAWVVLRGVGVVAVFCRPGRKSWVQ
jgi:hypothetical protein